MPPRFPTSRTSIRFLRPAGMKISWYAANAAGGAGFSSTQIDVPGRYNFSQAAIYRLKLTNIEGRPGVSLYPTLEVVPSNAKTDPFLAHSSVPVEFTNEDLDQVAAGNYVVKVIYLPDPQFQDVAAAGGLEEIVSSRLEPGVDPVCEAMRRGSILLIIRLGNIDLELENSPAMDAPNPYMHQPPPKPALGPMVPYGPHGPLMGANPMMGPGGPMLPPGMIPPADGKKPATTTSTKGKGPWAKQTVPVSKPIDSGTASPAPGPDLPLLTPGQAPK
jgi:hypothetical protein